MANDLTVGLVGMHEGKPTTTSLIVAEKFGKRHDNVLRDIDAAGCTKEFHLLNFEEITYMDGKGRKQRAVRMTRNGWLWLVMGYTGPLADKIREAYMAAFDEKERQLAAGLGANLPLSSMLRAAANIAEANERTDRKLLVSEESNKLLTEELEKERNLRRAWEKFGAEVNAKAVHWSDLGWAHRKAIQEMRAKIGSQDDLLTKSDVANPLSLVKKPPEMPKGPFGEKPPK